MPPPAFPSSPPRRTRNGPPPAPPAAPPPPAPRQVPTPRASPLPPPAPDRTAQGTALGWDGSAGGAGQVRVAREHGVADIIDFAFGMMRSSFTPIVGVVALLGGPGLVLTGIGVVLTDVATNATTGQLQTVSPVWWTILGLGVVALAVGAIATEPAIIHVAMAGSRQEAPRIGASAWFGVRKVPGLFMVWTALMLLALLPVLVSTFLAIAVDELALTFLLTLPATLAAFLVALMVGHLVTAAVVAEPIGAWRGLGRIRRLLRSQFWRTFGRGLVFGLLIQILSGIVQVGSVVGLALGPRGAIVTQVLAYAMQYLVLVPLTAMAALGLYADLRLRAEGIDELALL